MKVKQAEPEGFSQFWEIWQPNSRHTDTRADARNAYRKHLLLGTEPRDLIDGARGYFFFMKERDKPYVQLVATWMNKEAYVDWSEKMRKWDADQAAKEAEREAKRTAPPPKPIIQPEQPSEDRAAIAKRMAEKFPMLRGMH